MSNTTRGIKNVADITRKMYTISKEFDVFFMIHKSFTDKYLCVNTGTITFVFAFRLCDVIS